MLFALHDSGAVPFRQTPAETPSPLQDAGLGVRSAVWGVHGSLGAPHTYDVVAEKCATRVCQTARAPFDPPRSALDAPSGAIFRVALQARVSHDVGALPCLRTAHHPSQSCYVARAFSFLGLVFVDKQTKHVFKHACILFKFESNIYFTHMHMSNVYLTGPGCGVEESSLRIFFVCVCTCLPVRRAPRQTII